MNTTDNSESLMGQLDPRNTSSTGLALYHLDHVLTRIASALERITDDREDRRDPFRKPLPQSGEQNIGYPLLTPASVPIAAPADPPCVTGASVSQYEAEIRRLEFEVSRWKAASMDNRASPLDPTERDQLEALKRQLAEHKQAEANAGAMAEDFNRQMVSWMAEAKRLEGQLAQREALLDKRDVLLKEILLGAYKPEELKPRILEVLKERTP